MHGVKSSHEETNDNLNEDFIATTCLFDFREPNEKTEVATDTYSPRELNKNDSVSSSWSPRFELQRKRIGDLWHDIGDVFTDEASNVCSTDSIADTHTEEAEIQQTTKSGDSLPLSPILPDSQNGASTDSAKKMGENSKISSVEDCIIITDDELEEEVIEKFPNVNDRIEEARKQRVFSELFISIPNNNILGFQDETLDGNTQLGNHEFLLKIYNEDDFQQNEGSNIPICTAGLMPVGETNLLSPIKPGDRVEFRNGTLVKLNSGQTNGDKSNPSIPSISTLSFPATEPRRPRRYAIDTRFREPCHNLGPHIHSPRERFYIKQYRPHRRDRDIFSNYNQHFTKSRHFADDRHLHRKGHSRHCTTRCQPRRRTVLDNPPSVHHGDHFDGDFMIHSAQSCLYKSNPRFSNKESPREDGHYDVGDWSDWQWLCDPLVENTTNDNSALVDNTTNDNSALVDNITSDNNVLGDNTTYDNSVLGDNTTYANSALVDNTTKNNNALADNTTYYNNVLGDNTTNDNIALGDNTTNNALGDNNCVLGDNTNDNSVLGDNTSNDYIALGDNTTYDNSALVYNTTYDNSALGDSTTNNALGDNNNVLEDNTNNDNNVLGDNKTNDNIVLGDNKTNDNNFLGDNTTNDNSVLGDNTTYANSVLGDNTIYDNNVLGDNTNYANSVLGDNTTYDNNVLGDNTTNDNRTLEDLVEGVSANKSDNADTCQVISGESKEEKGGDDEKQKVDLVDHLTGSDSLDINGNGGENGEDVLFDDNEWSWLVSLRSFGRKFFWRLFLFFNHILKMIGGIYFLRVSKGVLLPLNERLYLYV